VTLKQPPAWRSVGLFAFLALVMLCALALCRGQPQGVTLLLHVKQAVVAIAGFAAGKAGWEHHANARAAAKGVQITGSGGQ
jgi:hypothetical protein